MGFLDLQDHVLSRLRWPISRHDLVFIERHGSGGNPVFLEFGVKRFSGNAQTVCRLALVGSGRLHGIQDGCFLDFLFFLDNHSNDRYIN